MPGRNFLFIPGPTNVPRRIQNAINIEQEDMRAMDLPEFTKPLYEDLKKVFKTRSGRVFIFPASGTGGRHRRIIFYDYDEVSLVTECHFRDIPEADDYIDELRSDTWYYVGEHDIFPEEFIKFLSMNRELQSLFLEVHGDLLTADYWRDIQAMHRAGEVSVVVPYFRPALPPKQLQKLKTA